MNFFILSEAVGDYYTVLYHGTGVDNIKSIMSQGLKINSPLTTSGRGTTAVYLTPNIKLAARYSVGGLSDAPLNRIPAILEIKLFGNRRHGSMESDPLDRSDTAWQRHYEMDNSDKEAIRELENDVEKFIVDMSKRYQFPLKPYYHVSLGHEFEGLRGFQLYKYIISTIARLVDPVRFRQIKNEIVRLLNTDLAPGTNYEGKLVITDSGTLQLTPDYWETMHQNMYKRNIPPAAIKAVWVRKSDFPNLEGEEKKFGTELLPQEVVDKYEDEKNTLENIGRNVRKLIDNFLDDRDDKDYYIDKLNDLKSDDFESYIDDIIAGMDEEDFDFDPLIDEIEQRGYELAGDLNDDVGRAVETNKTTWIRVSPKSLI